MLKGIGFVQKLVLAALCSRSLFPGSEHLIDLAVEPDNVLFSHIDKVFSEEEADTPKKLILLLKDIASVGNIPDERIDVFKSTPDVDLKKLLLMVDALIQKVDKVLNMPKGKKEEEIRLWSVKHHYAWVRSFRDKKQIDTLLKYGDWSKVFPKLEDLRLIKFWCMILCLMPDYFSNLANKVDLFKAVFKFVADNCHKVGIDTENLASPDDNYDSKDVSVDFLGITKTSLPNHIDRILEFKDIHQDLLATCGAWSHDYPYKRISNIIRFIEAAATKALPSGFFGKGLKLFFTNGAVSEFVKTNNDNLEMKFLVQQNNTPEEIGVFSTDVCKSSFDRNDKSLVHTDVLTKPFLPFLQALYRTVLHRFLDLFLYPEKEAEGDLKIVQVSDLINAEKFGLFEDLLKYCKKLIKIELCADAPSFIRHEFTTNFVKYLELDLFEKLSLPFKPYDDQNTLKIKLENIWKAYCFDIWLQERLHFLKTVHEGSNFSVYSRFFCYINPIKERTLTKNDQNVFAEKTLFQKTLQHELNKNIGLQSTSEAQDKYLMMRFLSFTNPSLYEDFLRYMPLIEQDQLDDSLNEFKEEDCNKISDNIFIKVFCYRFFKCFKIFDQEEDYKGLVSAYKDVEVEEISVDDKDQPGFQEPLKQLVGPAFDFLKQKIFLDKVKDVSDRLFVNRKGEALGFVEQRFEWLKEEFVLEKDKDSRSQQFYVLKDAGVNTFQRLKEKFLVLLQGGKKHRAEQSSVAGIVRQPGILERFNQGLRDFKEELAEKTSKKQEPPILRQTSTAARSQSLFDEEASSIAEKEPGFLRRVSQLFKKKPKKRSATEDGQRKDFDDASSTSASIAEAPVDGISDQDDRVGDWVDQTLHPTLGSDPVVSPVIEDAFELPGVDPVVVPTHTDQSKTSTTVSTVQRSPVVRLNEAAMPRSVTSPAIIPQGRAQSFVNGRSRVSRRARLVRPRSVDRAEKRFLQQNDSKASRVQQLILGLKGNSSAQTKLRPQNRSSNSRARGSALRRTE